MDIGGAISAVTAAIGFARELNNVDIQVDQASLKLKVAELTTALADAKLGLVDVADELHAGEKEIARLQDAIAFKTDRTEHYRGYTYELSADGDKVGLPFCPLCLEKGQFSRLVSANRSGRPKVCPKCHADFGHVTEFSWIKKAP
ncbi:hypothetical protein [Kaistia terrae]|uniref:Uncharacterized protein n=1 Tax=Kaistia terrae TaxID=537017 RepID=A0ABW0PXR6_9HYPH|nr:hypothetical protein [Kaistia terrae]MCX5579462.1 hypothetical protein [Kaistia terrae]